MSFLASKRKFFDGLAISFLASVLTLFFIEGISFLILKMNKERERTICGTNLYDTQNDDNLGIILKADNKHHAIKSYSDGTVIYDVVYTTDQYRRRDVRQTYRRGNPHLILFGCSQIYGEGLSDHETLQYKLYEKMLDYNVYNYAVHGYGPQHMLALLQKGDLPKEVDSQDGVAIYGLANSHIERAIGSSQLAWLKTAPYYYLDKDDKLRRKGSFLTGRPFISKIYKIFVMSNFVKLMKLHLPLRISQRHLRLTFKIIAEAKKEYERQFNGAFYVLVLSDDKNRGREMLVKMLDENNINVLQFKSDHREDYSISGDGHSSEKFNEFLAENVVTYLNLKTDMK